MYNGIGLETARGSGTNGFVQRNMSFIRRHKDKVDYKSEEELKKIEAQMTKGPNKDILDHERKRKVELKCMEMQELMEEQGYELLKSLPELPVCVIVFVVLFIRWCIEVAVVVYQLVDAKAMINV